MHIGTCNAEENKLFPTPTVDWASNKLPREIDQWVGRWCLSAVTSFKGTASVLLIWLPAYLNTKECQKLRKASEGFVAYSLFHAQLQEETSKFWDLLLRRGHRDQKLQRNKMRTASSRAVRCYHWAPKYVLLADHSKSPEGDIKGGVENYSEYLTKSDLYSAACKPGRANSK